MVSISFTTEEMGRLRELLDLDPREQPTADKILVKLAAGADAELSLDRGDEFDTPLVADAMKRRKAAALQTAKQRGA
jgi:hypothetical protein